MKQFKIRPSITNRDSKALNIYLKDISKYKILTPEQEKELAAKMRSGDKKAKNLLISSNLRFVVSIAKQYQGKGILLEDLVAAGNEGLIEACNRFNETLGYRFLSYAAWWIRNKILNVIELYSNTIKIPLNKTVAINRLNNIINNYIATTELPPSISELAKFMNMSENDIQDLLINSRIGVNRETIINEDGEEESIYESCSSESDLADKDLLEKNTQEDIKDILSSELSKLEYNVIIKFFGFGESPKTPEEIGRDLGITKERIRQIKDKAILKLRKSDKLNLLYNYL